MRRRVLLLSRYEYDGTIVGGICQNWSNDKQLENQTKGKVKAADGSEAPLWTQDLLPLLTGFCSTVASCRANRPIKASILIMVKRS